MQTTVATAGAALLLRRISSFDRSGNNQDGDHKHPIQPGGTRLIGEVEGPGIIKHMCIAFFATEPSARCRQWGGTPGPRGSP